MTTSHCTLVTNFVTPESHYNERNSKSQTSAVVFDSGTHEIESVTTATVDEFGGQYPTELIKYSFRRAVTHTIENHNPDNLHILKPDIRNPWSELENLDIDLQDVNITFITQNNTSDKLWESVYTYYEEIANALLEQHPSETIQGKFSENQTGTATNKLKVYTDGSWKPKEESQTIGYAIFDESGDLLQIHSEKIEGFESVNRQSLDSEYRAVQIALKHAEKYTHGSIELIIDNHRVFETVEENSLEPIGTMKHHVKQIEVLKNNFETVSITHRPRDKNPLADALAKSAHAVPLSSF